MSDFQERAVSADSTGGELMEKEEVKPESTSSAADDMLSSSDVFPTSTTNGIEELESREDEDASHGIMDGFETEKKPEVNGMNNITNGSLEQEGFDEKSSFTETKQEDAILRSPLALWMSEHNINHAVMKLIYWQEKQHTAGVFGGILFLLLSLKFYPIISVVATFAMSLLAVAFLYRIGMTIVNAVQKTSAEHPFKNLLEEKVELSEEMVQHWAERTRNCINSDIKHMQRLFLVESVIESLKFGVLLWLVSYIGSWFSLLTMAILGVIVLFTIPKLYEEKQAQIDQAFIMGKDKVCDVYAKLEQRLPEKVKGYFNKEKKE